MFNAMIGIVMFFNSAILAPAFTAALPHQSPTAVQATSGLCSVPAPIEEVRTGNELTGYWSVSGELSVGEYAMPYRISGHLKAHDGEPILEKLSIGEGGRMIEVEIPASIQTVVSEYSAYLDTVFEMVAKFRLSGLEVRFCADLFCVTAKLDAEGTVFDRTYISTP